MTVRELIKRLREECKGEMMDAEVMVYFDKSDTLEPVTDVAHEGPCMVELIYKRD